MMKQLAVGLIGVLAAFCLSTRQAGAVLVASDDASDPTYNNGWGTDDNGGTGFSAWSSLGHSNSPTGSAGVFIANNSGDSQINTAGDAFGLYANGGGVSQAIRSFTNAINVTDTVSLAMDNGFIDGGGTVGFGLQSSGGTNLFEFYFANGNPNYQVSQLGGPASTGVGYTNLGLQLSFTLTDANSFSFSIDRLFDGVGTNVTTVTGDLAAAGNISRIRLFNANAGFNSDHDAFFNSIVVTAVPEASAYLCFGAVGLVAGYWRLKKRRCRPLTA
jgi:hypothetical protein